MGEEEPGLDVGKVVWDGCMMISRVNYSLAARAPSHPLLRPDCHRRSRRLAVFMENREREVIRGERTRKK